MFILAERIVWSTGLRASLLTFVQNSAEYKTKKGAIIAFLGSNNLPVDDGNIKRCLQVYYRATKENPETRQHNIMQFRSWAAAEKTYIFDTLQAAANKLVAKQILAKEFGITVSNVGTIYYVERKKRNLIVPRVRAMRIVQHLSLHKALTRLGEINQLAANEVAKVIAKFVNNVITSITNTVPSNGAETDKMQDEIKTLSATIAVLQNNNTKLRSKNSTLAKSVEAYKATYEKFVASLANADVNSGTTMIKTGIPAPKTLKHVHTVIKDLNAGVKKENTV